MKKNDTEYTLILVEAGIRLVSVHLRSQKELEMYLTKKLHRYGSDDLHIVALAIERLRELGYVDDRAYAHAFVASRIARHQKGDILLRMELRQKGVSDALIHAVLSSDTSTEGATEYDRARVLLEKKKKLFNLPYLERKRKIFAYFSRRGFGSDIIRRVIDEEGETSYNTEHSEE